MRIKSWVMSIMLVAGLVAGCGGVADGTELGAPAAGGEGSEVRAEACNDCHWLYVRCMSRASTNEAAAQCEESRALCEETFCNMTRQADACSNACDTKLNTCLRAGGVHPSICFDRHGNCTANCPITE
jgi:hypothetical protein